MCQLLCLPVCTSVVISDLSRTPAPGINQARNMQSRNNLKQQCHALELNHCPFPISQQFCKFTDLG